MTLSRFTAAAALVAALAVPFAAGAQSVPASAAAPNAPAAGHRHHGNRFMHALRTLNLSDAQKAQIRGFARDAKSANVNADPAARKANAEKLHAQIEGVLTPEQRMQLQTELQRERSAAPATR